MIHIWMDYLHIPWFCMAVTGVFGLMVGSFLNVVIYRLPIMMQQEWRSQCREFLELGPEPVSERFDFIWPLSRCPSCQSFLKPYHNIPVISYWVLRGKCAYCHQAIAIRYPLV